MYFELFCYYLPLEKDMMSPSPIHALCQAWLIFAWRFWEIFQILSSGSWKEDENVEKFTEKRTDGQQTTGNQKSLLEL